MDPDRYLALVRIDADRLLDVAAGQLDAPVPSCPGWTMADLVEHVGRVYLHKIESIRQQRDPEPWPPPPHGREPIEWLAETTTAMLDLLAELGPRAPSHTWHPEDQTVGFWFRRMAQETAVHRVDAELAAGSPTPVDAELALDGIDELLEIFLAGDWSDLPQPDLTGRVALAAGGRRWLIVLEPEVVRVEEHGDAATLVRAEPSDLYLW
ncbi:MAG: maleylpyruvate isomerase family mycothiol-dependent enzyme, partial [Geodermatophilaceae bacterium]|nr:maleylpyruvate isomerase family mycothiol-dependent enzyme [Geodermatophilaceae bacterium]